VERGSAICQCQIVDVFALTLVTVSTCVSPGKVLDAGRRFLRWRAARELRVAGSTDLASWRVNDDQPKRMA